MLYRNIIILLVVLLIVGCSSNSTTPLTQIPSLSVPFPKPIQSYHFDWEVLVREDKPYVMLPYDQAIDLRIYMEDILRYIRDSNDVICYYKALNNHIDDNCLTESVDD